MSSGGNECARSSRRGAGLTSSSLGGGLDPDGPQGHAVVTQKRKLRTPVWARLRNIHISDPRYTTPFVPNTSPLLWTRPCVLPIHHPPPLLSSNSPPYYIFTPPILRRPFRIRAVDALCRPLCRTIGSRSRVSKVEDDRR